MRSAFITAAVMAAAICMTTAPARAEVSWLDLLADPDNAALNQQFVAERLADGDLPAALSAVERLVIARPTDVPLRILRAEILVNLGNDTLALGELEALAKLPLLPDQTSKIEQLQDIIDARTKSWRTAASISLGLRASDNANSYPSSGLMDFLVTGATEPSTREYQSYGGATKSLSEAAATAGTVVVASYELPNQDRDTVSAGVSHSESRGRKYEFLTSSNSSAFVGASLRLGDITLRPNLRYTESSSKTSSNSAIAAGSLTAAYTLPFKVQGSATAEYSIVDRIPSKNFTTANQNDGHSQQFRLGFSRSLLPQMTGFVEGRYGAFNPMETRYAQSTIPYNQAIANQNRSRGGTVGLLVAATPNVRVRASLDASDTKYMALEANSRLVRRDTQTRASLGLQIAGRAFSQKLERFSLAVNASTTKNDSTVRQYDYKRSDASVVLNYQLGD